MSASVELPGCPVVREPPPSEPLDEAVWQAWVAKGRAQDRRGRAERMKALKWVSIAGLLLASASLSHFTTYETVVRFIVAAGAIVVMFRAFHARRYVFAAVSGALALVYNPVAPAFSFSGGWQLAVVMASAVPLAASLAWRNLRTEHND